MKLHSFINKSLPILSASFLFIATIVFLIVEHSYSEKITNLVKMEQQTAMRIRDARESMRRANNIIYHLDLLNDNIDILNHLGFEEGNIKKKQSHLLDRAKHAVFETLNGALASAVIDLTEAEKVIGSLNSLTELQDIILQYEIYLETSKEGTEQLVKEMLGYQLMLKTSGTTKGYLLFISFGCQFLGVICAILVLFFRKLEGKEK